MALQMGRKGGEGGMKKGEEDKRWVFGVSSLIQYKHSSPRSFFYFLKDVRSVCTLLHLQFLDKVGLCREKVKGAIHWIQQERNDVSTKSLKK